MTPDQKSAWLSARCGLLTASRMAEAMGKKGPAARRKLLIELCEERLTGQTARHVVTDAMLHGLDSEGDMFDLFVERYPQYSVRTSRFYTHPTIEYFGATPDREIGDDGLLEGKAPSTAKYIEWRLAGVVPEEHKWQMLAQIACTGRKWVGFVAYDPRIKDESKRLFLRKYEPQQHEIGAVEEAASGFLRELDALWDAFHEIAA